MANSLEACFLINECMWCMSFCLNKNGARLSLSSCIFLIAHICFKTVIICPIVSINQAVMSWWKTNQGRSYANMFYWNNNVLGWVDVIVKNKMWDMYPHLTCINWIWIIVVCAQCERKSSLERKISNNMFSPHAHTWKKFENVCNQISKKNVHTFWIVDIYFVQSGLF